MEKITYSITEAAKVLGISRSYAYQLVKKGELPVLDIGTRKVVPKILLAQWIIKQTKNK